MSGLVLGDAVNRAGSTEPAKIREALLQTKIPPEQTITAWGGIEFDPENGQNKLATYCIQQFSDGKWNLAWPFDAAEIDLIYPAPKWSERG
jgi:branched-chain amino acid transport system substrate-binding protein